ncbi:MAG: ATP-dependent sacrificial sulfur transferase LarE [Chloroflexi bacterium]|nr:ATP-dependent sacrificial sulfur transferase LarE [Chloroflexota bacterium]
MSETAEPSPEALAKEAQALALLRAQTAVGVAFSGGVDSTYLLALAVDALGPGPVLAVTAATEFIRPDEVEQAQRLAAHLGVRHQVATVSLLQNSAVAGNPPDRCYWCKAAVVEALARLAERMPGVTLVHGANGDDLGDYRPGEQAARERGLLAPLQAAGLTKLEIRTLARARGLPNWDQPAAACLATRFPYGEPQTAEGLRRVAEAEGFLRQEVGLRNLRVRSHGAVARLEIPPDDWSAVLDPARRAQVVERLRALGFLYVTLDLMGLRSGSMNDALRPS